jgi:dTDP-4-dehydrorhamnose 3,5-epimerase
MKFSNRSKVQDVKIFTHEKFSDSRGGLVKIFNKNEAAGLLADLGELNGMYQTLSKRDVLRGFHYQVEKPQSRLMRVSYGAIYDVILDLRKSSPTFGKWQAEILTSENPSSIWIPAGIAHAYLVMSEFAIVDVHTSVEYQPDLQRVIRWNDPALGIDWPLYSHYPISVQPILSDRDQLGLDFSQADLFE